MRCGRNLKSKIFKHVTQKSYLGTHSVVALRWMPRNFTNGKSTLVVIMAWCHQATSHLLSHCWPKSISPYGIIRPQWVKRIRVVTVLITDNANINEEVEDIDYKFDVQWWKNIWLAFLRNYIWALISKWFGKWVSCRCSCPFLSFL